MIDNLSRRDILLGVGAGVGTAAIGTETAVAAPPERHIVGTSTPAAAEAAERAADAVSRRLDFEGIGRAVAGTFPEEALEGLRRRPDVRYVERDGRYHAIGEVVPWGVDRVDADVVHANGETGGDDDDGRGGADIAIIDTGIDDDHPDLEANVGTGTAFVECQGSNCNRPWSDDDGHGTHCAGIADAEDNAEGVVGVSTSATLHAVKVLDGDGAGYWSDIASGIEWVADQGYEVASMSLGGSAGSATIEDACRYAYEKGVLLVAAAGNDGSCSDCVSYPAKYDTVMAISATTADDSLASFSATGPEIELAAPGEEIYSTVIGGYDTYSGTSMASPHVCGAGAQLMDNGYTNDEARQRLADAAEDIGLPSDEQGAGLLDVEAAMSGNGDSELDVSWTNPSDGEDVSGTVTLQIAVSDVEDAEDADDSVTVEYRVDEEAWRAATYDSSNGHYEDDWDTTAVSDGDHMLDARATAADGTRSAEASATVTVTNAASSPAIDRYAVTEAGSPDPHAEITAEWAVEDADGDLDEVVLEVSDADTGSVRYSHTHSVDGSTAADTDALKIKHVAGQTFDVTLSVTDASGNAVSETKTVTE